MEKLVIYAFVCCIALSPVCAQGEEQSDLHIRLDGDRVELAVTEASLEAVLGELTRQSGGVLQFGPIDEKTVSLTHPDITLERLLSELGVNNTLVYRVDRATGDIALEEGWAASDPGTDHAGNRPRLPGELDALIDEVLSPLDDQIRAALGHAYPAVYPVTVEVDGGFGDWPASLRWHVIDASSGCFVPTNAAQRKIPHHRKLPEDTTDAAFAFAAVADEENLYFAVQVFDDKKVVNEHQDDEMIWNDDTVEFYIDGGNEKAPRYDENDTQITVARAGDRDDPANPRISPWKGRGRGIPGNKVGMRAIVADNDEGWTIEAAVPLSTFGVLPRDGLSVGFNMHVNDDDDGGRRDHKLMWSAKEKRNGERAFHDPRVFGRLEFFDLNGRKKARTFP